MDPDLTCSIDSDLYTLLVISVAWAHWLTLTMQIVANSEPSLTVMWYSHAGSAETVEWSSISPAPLIDSVLSHTQHTVCLGYILLLVAPEVDILTSLLPFIVVWIADFEHSSAVFLDPDSVKGDSVAVTVSTASSISSYKSH